MKIRRILTGHDAQGRSLVADDSFIESHRGKMDAAKQDFPVLPSNGGAVFRMLELMPGTAPHMHKTETIDYIVVLAGTLSMLLDDGTELAMKPHEAMIQRATVHGWANRGSEPCRFATVVIDATGARE